MENKRQPGYYRVKQNGAWKIVSYLDTWYQGGERMIFTDFEEIDPTPIDPNAAQQPTGQQFTSKDEVYSAHQAIVDALGGHRGKELDLLVKLAYTAIAGIHETMPQPAGQLTAEGVMYEVFNLFNDHERGVLSIEYRNEKGVAVIEQYGRMVLDIPRFEREHKQLRYGNDYLFLAEGEEEKPRHQDGIVTLWNEDVQGALSLHMFQNFYYLLTGAELQNDLEKLKLAINEE